MQETKETSLITKKDLRIVIDLSVAMDQECAKADNFN